MDTDLGPGIAQILGDKDFIARVSWIGIFKLGSRTASGKVAWKLWPSSRTEAALVVAFLDNWKSGRFRLECVEERRFILPDRMRVAVFPGDRMGPSPPSLEGELVVEAIGEEGAYVYDLVRSWFREDMPYPWSGIAKAWLEELCKDGVLKRSVSRRWLIFSDVHYSFAASADVSAWMDAFNYGQQLLVSTASENPELCSALLSEIGSAFLSRNRAKPWTPFD